MTRLDWEVLLDDVLGLRLDGFEVVFVEVDAGDVVVEAVVSPRSQREFRLGELPLECLGEDVCSRVSQDVDVLVGLVCYDFEGDVLVQRRVFVDEFAVDDAGDRVATEAGADLEGGVFDGGSVLHVEGGTVGQRDRAHARDKSARRDKCSERGWRRPQEGPANRER